MSRRKVLLVENHEGMARVVTMALSSDPQMELLAHCDTLAQAATLLPQAEVVVLDLNLPDSRGVSTVAAVEGCESQAPIVVYSADAAPDRLPDGAAAWVRKGNVSELLRTLRRVLSFDRPGPRQ